MENSQLVSNENPPHSWSLPQALIVGIIGYCTMVGAIISLAALAPTYHLSRLESQAIDIIIECIAIAATGYFTVRFLRRRTSKDFWGSIEWRESHREFVVFAGIGLLVSLLFHCVMKRHLSIEITGLSNLALFILVAVSTAILQPIIEEVYFRGILYASLENKLNSIASIVIVTIVFVTLHPQHQLIVLPISVLLGIVRITTSSTANCFALHAAYNLGVILWGIR